MKTGNIILFVLCAIAMIVGIVIYFEASAFQKTAIITQGTVVNSGTTYYDIKYTSGDDIERTYKGSQPKNGKHRDGETMKVFYQSGNPDKARITDGVKGGKKVVFWAFIMLLFNLVSVYSGRKKDKSEKNFKTT